MYDEDGVEGSDEGSDSAPPYIGAARAADQSAAERAAPTNQRPRTPHRRYRRLAAGRDFRTPLNRRGARLLTPPPRRRPLQGIGPRQLDTRQHSGAPGP